jgi:hypothetical protein
MEQIVGGAIQRFFAKLKNFVRPQKKVSEPSPELDARMQRSCERLKVNWERDKPTGSP